MTMEFFLTSAHRQAQKLIASTSHLNNTKKKNENHTYHYQLHCHNKWHSPLISQYETR